MKERTVILSAEVDSGMSLSHLKLLVRSTLGYYFKIRQIQVNVIDATKPSAKRKKVTRGKSKA